MRQEVNSQNFFWSAITLSIWCTTEPVRMSLRTIKVPQCVSDVKLSLCVADLSLAASQELCFERDAGRALPSAVGSWVSTASFNI